MSLILQVEQQVTSSMSFINLDDEVFQSDETTVEVEHVSPLRCEEVLLEEEQEEDDRITVELQNAAEAVANIRLRGPRDAFNSHLDRRFPFAELETPFQLTKDDTEKLERMKCAETKEELPWNIVQLCEPVESGVKWPQRRLYSEFDDVYKYTPFFARQPQAISLAGFEPNLSCWEEFMDMDQSIFVDTLSNHSANIIMIKFLDEILDLDEMPPTIRDILLDLLYRVKFAYGKAMCAFARRVYRACHYPLMNHVACNLEWRPVAVGYNIEHDCICCDYPEATLRHQALDTCCYTWTSIVVNRPNNRANDLQSILKEDYECIRIIQRLYLPIHSTGCDLFLNPARFSDCGLKHGLCLAVKVPWAKVFNSLQGYNRLSDISQHSHLMKLFINILLTAEFYNRGSPKALFPWDCYEVTELINTAMWEEVFMDRVEQVLNVVRYGNLPFLYEWFKDTRFIDLSLEELQSCIVRSVNDCMETTEVFECDICLMECQSESLILLDFESAANTTVCEEFQVALDNGVMEADFCSYHGTTNSHDTAEHILSGECCEYHMTRDLVKIRWLSDEFKRVCWDCMGYCKNYLFLGRSTFDCSLNANQTRQGHAGAWWFDLGKLYRKLNCSKVKRANTCNQC